MKTAIVHPFGVKETIDFSSFDSAWLEAWLDDMPNAIDEMMLQPLHITHPLAFRAPEEIRDAAVREYIITR